MTLFSEFLRTSFYTSIYIILLIFLRNNLFKKYTYTFSYNLYILVIFKLSVIIKIPINIYTNLNLVDNSNRNIDILNKSNISHTKFIYVLFYIWLLGVIVITFYKLYYNIKIFRQISKSKQNVYDENIINSLEKQKKYLNIKQNIDLFKLNGVYTPMLVGLFNAKIIIPVREYKDFELDFIFRHELIHFKRKDNYLKLILDIVSIVHWFNPFVHIFRKNFNEFCELSCDERVLENSKIEEIKLYSLLLLDTIKYKNELNMLMYSSQFSKDNYNKLKGRIYAMLGSRSKKNGKLLVCVCSAITLLSVVSFKTTAYGEMSEKSLVINTQDSDFIKAVATNNLTGYVKKTDLYNQGQTQETLEQVRLYMKNKENFRIIPVYDKKGEIIGEYRID